MAESIPALSKVLVFHGRTGSSPELTNALFRAEYTVVADLPLSSNFLTDLTLHKPQMVLLTNELTPQELSVHIRDILILRIATVVLMTEEWNSSISRQIMRSGAAGYLLKPFDVGHVTAALESAWHYFQKLLILQDNLELRKLIEKAKGILMEEQFINEEEAHQKLLKMSQDHSIPLKSVCLSVIQVNSISQKKKFQKG